jgi:nitrite reductase/ring-hydroxylating ferredoxin subunit
MLTKEQNELLCRVGPGTPMGELMRQYWIPALLSSEVPRPDSDPLRVRLLGEDLIAFRNTNGRVGLIANNCPHRGASLFFGRNEEAGLRCVYHGWKFDVDGTCVDMPNEPAESDFKQKVRATAYPCVERAGIVWSYMGARTPPAELPAFEALDLSQDHIRLGRRYQEENYAQALEGGIDSAHASCLHSSITPPAPGQGGLLDQARRRSKSAYLSVEGLANGLLIGARRELPDGNDYWRTNLFLMPFYTQSPGGEHGHFNAWVPMDDEHTLRVAVAWNPHDAITDEGLAETARRTGRRQALPGGFISQDDLLPATTQPGGAWRARANKTNDYLLDRELQRTKRFSGVDGGNIGTEDLSVQESMGAIFDRSNEHLGTTDVGIIQTRRLLMESALAWKERQIPPPGVLEPRAYHIHATDFTLPRGEDWVAVAHERMTRERQAAGR